MRTLVYLQSAYVRAGFHMCPRVTTCACVCVRARACVCACARARVCVFVWVGGSGDGGLCAGVCVCMHNCIHQPALQLGNADEAAIKLK